MSSDATDNVSTTLSPGRTVTFGIAVTAVAIAITAGIYVANLNKPSAIESFLSGDFQATERALTASARDPIAIRRFFSQVLHPDNVASFTAEHWDCLLRLSQIPKSEAIQVTQQRRIAEAALDAGWPSVCLKADKLVLDQNPVDIESLRRTVFIRSVLGQRWEARDAELKLLKTGAMTLRELAIFADAERPLAAESLLAEWAERTGDPSIASTESTDQTVDSPEALKWRASMALKYGDRDTAAWFLQRAFQLAPTSREVTGQLAQLLTADHSPMADELVRYADHLYQIAEAIDPVLSDDAPTEQSLRRVSESMLATGRLWEAAAWAVIAGRLFPQNKWSEKIRADSVRNINPSTPRVHPNYLPNVPELPGTNQQMTDRLEELNAAALLQTPVDWKSEIRFRCDPQALQFSYNNAHDPATPGARMCEITGGGIGVLDLDLDSWPDLYCSQGGAWNSQDSLPPTSFDEHDTIFRNVRGSRFIEVDGVGIDDRGFGQGCSVGDFNNDGFPDVFVANIGRNQLFENLGDGTFIEVTLDNQDDVSSYSTSCSIADLNHDGLPDLYAVNYVQGDDIYTRICQQLACSPLVFEGATDIIHLNAGDGTFVRVDDVTPKNATKGLGLAITRTDDSETSVFIANDQVANCFLTLSKDTMEVSRDRFDPMDSALSSGLAYSNEGLAMACMGIAVGDADNNGLTDYFVTNFRGEPNTLYLQDVAGLFLDSSARCRIRQSGIPFVGWGTQFVDADLDGWLDLVVTNGHVDDYPEDEGGYAMRPQVFHNHRGEFVELSSDEAGEVFEQRFVGRSLTRIDWNHDGLDDLCLGTLHGPYQLLTNDSEPQSSSVVFQLIGTSADRDAVGTRVINAETNIVRRLHAGDGYLSSNEKLVRHVLRSNQPTEFEFQWPSGTTETQVIEASGTYIVVEGTGLFAIP